MKILISGGTGFLGQPLASRLAARGDDVVVLTRRVGPGRSSDGPREVAWSSDWRNELDGADAVINLAGAGIADKRWTPARKALIRSSRIDTTRSLVDAVRNAPRRPAIFIQGSAVGYYGATLDDVAFDESSRPGDDFLGRVCVEWEGEARAVEALGCRLVLIRTGVALDAEGGALPQMARPFQFFVGGVVASGRQVLSWIHRDDWVAMVVWALDTGTVSGPINATAPEAATNLEFSRALGRALHRPCWAPAPGFALRLLFGELADALLIKGQRVVPARSEALGFQHAYPDLASALSEIYLRARRS